MMWLLVFFFTFVPRLPPIPSYGTRTNYSLPRTPHALYVYSLALGRVVAVWAPPASSSTSSKDARGARERDREQEPDKDAIGTPSVFDASGKVLVVTTHSPPALVVLSRPSLRLLHVIPAGALAAMPVPAHPAPAHGASHSTGSYSSAGSPPSNYPSAPPPPATPTFALHGRLLAFLAPPPTAPPPALDGARAADTWGRSFGTSIGRFFSRSAPAASALASGAAGLFAGESAAAFASVSSALQGGGAGGSWVRVVDLEGEKEGGALRELHAFQAGRSPVGALKFTRDGTAVVAVRRDGLGAGVWGIRPAVNAEAGAGPAQLYELRRGRTGAVVEGIAGARDGRFIALATRRRTVHVFAVNPYGGRADVRSHLGARVRDAEGGSVRGEEALTEVQALVRMRLPAAPQGEDAVLPAPLAVAFVPPAAPSTAHPLRSPASPALPASGYGGAPPSGVQDVLVFDPADGVLSLRRVTLALEAPHAAGLPISVSLPAGRLVMGTSMSMSASPPAYAASYARGYHQPAVTGGAGAGEAGPGVELGGREAVVATWSLRRRRGWAEIRRAEFGEAAVEARAVKQDWLAQAELSTFSPAPHALPRSIYLMHQLSFHTLGEDYHALIRRYQFAIGGAKIDVRREVEVSAFAGAGGAGGEAFVEGFASSSPRAIRRRSRASSSFDEPLASALAGAHYARPPPVLPMLPNGSPSSAAASFPFRTAALPVRAVADGVAEGLGRLRREMRQQRQHRQKQLARSPKGGDDVETSVPLAFDEEDEDFAMPPGAAGGDDDVFLRVHADREDDDALSATTSRNGDSVASVSTPATSAHALDEEGAGAGGIVDLSRSFELGDGAAGEETWHGWGAEDKRAVEEAERFDDISVVGFLDEEQAVMRVAEEQRRTGKGGVRKKRRN
ncbi:hypothetical protein B0H17DRAFT_561363 [Mycena rosella]|uniref:BCAS3 WD40 domain-containing protein n=1 Tax=Mycena rosella TaxID=1033263 RepID=A0AAD7DHE0_MYCRO|nr:hypothetical protein B0H17DRAFT_561363 [Mycena rosella]